MADLIVASFLDWSMRDPRAIAIVVALFAFLVFCVWAADKVGGDDVR